MQDGYDDDSEELEDLTIQPTDALIVSARNKHKLGLLEVWVYEDGDPNMFVHHHVVLSAFALCTAWLDLPLKGGEKGNIWYFTSL